MNNYIIDRHDYYQDIVIKLYLHNSKLNIFAIIISDKDQGTVIFWLLPQFLGDIGQDGLIG
jgi:hypothetical protein